MLENDPEKTNSIIAHFFTNLILFNRKTKARIIYMSDVQLVSSHIYNALLFLGR